MSDVEPDPACSSPTWYGPCGSYLTVAQAAALCGCEGLDLQPGDPEEEGGDPVPSADAVLLEQALGWASRRVFLASGQRFFGCCTATIRPCRTSCSAGGGVFIPGGFPWDSWPFGAEGWSSGFLPVWACACNPADSCSCSAWDKIPLPMLPVREIVAVKIDGETMDPAAYEVIDQAWLARTDGGRWPSCQTREADTEEGTWSVEYRHGLDLPPEALPLVASYACQLAKRCGGGECDLPEGVTVVHRDGVDFGVVEPAEYRELGLTGYGPIDDWIGLLNGGHVQEPPRIYRPGREAPVAWLQGSTP